MSNNSNSILTSNTLAKWFKKNLVLIDESEKDIPEVTNYTGKNKKHIMILVDVVGNASQEEALQFLLNVLKACNLTLDDIILVWIDNFSHVSYKQLKMQFDVRVCILFGIDAGRIKLPFSFPNFKLQSYDEVMFLQAPSVENFRKDTSEAKTLKADLWKSLRLLFQIK